MCGGTSAPEPQAPPAPVSQRETNIEGTMDRQKSAQRAAQSGYESTLLAGGAPNAATSPASVAAPKLGT